MIRCDNLKGRVAVITGAASGIGKAAAERLAEEGATVVIVDINAAEAEEAASRLRKAGFTADAAEADVRDSASINRIVRTVTEKHGNISILVNNAGGSARVIGKKTLFHVSEEATWEWVLNVNLKGVLICTRAVLDGMIGQRYGKIINIASIAGVAGISGMADYSAAKGGVIAFTKALAMELGTYNINVNCISPGAIETRKFDMSAGTYLGRGGKPEEVAGLISFLASDESGFITGQNYVIDGGRILGPLNVK